MVKPSFGEPLLMTVEQFDLLPEREDVVEELIPMQKLLDAGNIESLATRLREIGAERAHGHPELTAKLTAHTLASGNSLPRAIFQPCGFSSFRARSIPAFDPPSRRRSQALQNYFSF